MAHRVERQIYGVGYRETAAFKDTYGGEPGHVFIECMRIIPERVASDTVLVFSHSVGGGGFLPAITQFARDGHHVCSAAGRAAARWRCITRSRPNARRWRQRLRATRWIAPAPA